MYLINFGHPLTEAQKKQIEELLGRPLDNVIEVPCQFDHELPFARQIESLVDKVGLSPREWQSLPILINPPGFSPVACCLIAELHGRMGYFPPIVRFRPVTGTLPTQFALAEIILLQDIRDLARKKRPGETT